MPPVHSHIFRARIPTPYQGDRNAVDVNAATTRHLPHTPPGPSGSQNAGPSQTNADGNSSRPSLQPGLGHVGETWWARPVCETLSRAHAPDAFSRYSFHRVRVRCQQRTIDRIPLVQLSPLEPSYFLRRCRTCTGNERDIVSPFGQPFAMEASENNARRGKICHRITGSHYSNAGLVLSHSARSSGLGVDAYYRSRRVRAPQKA
jgi:hypothetical protein